MRTFGFELLLQEGGWQKDCFVTVDEYGKIKSISTRKPEGEVEKVSGYCLPGFQNAHSHAFQYAMAGLAEIHPIRSISNDFWSWRNTMYQIALSIGPDQLEAVASMLYAEMLRHGYTHVAAFHHLHHDPSGQPYANIAELGTRLLSAAKKAGINITLVPMFYQMGGFGKPAQEDQRRFISKTVEDYLELLAATERSIKNYPNTRLGVGFHSLRAVNKESIDAFFEQYSNTQPFHIHISEQLKEVNECEAFYGKRPVEWLLDNLPVANHFHLVHATHLNADEVIGIAKSGAHVVLCPSTEGNLGDGIFPLRTFMDHAGNWSVGTDSHIGLSPLEELRILDYGQRLISHQRDQLVTKETGDSGRVGFNMALHAGRAAMGNKQSQYFEVGQPFDAIVINETHPLIATSSTDKLLSTFIYAGDPSFISGTITKGQWQVKDGKHLQGENILKDFKVAMKNLAIR